MKKLALRHAFALARIIKAADIRSEVVAFASEFREGKDVNEVGMEFILTMIQAAADETVEKKIYQLYADLKGTNADEVADYDLETVKTDMKKLIEQNDLKSFFNSVSALMSKQ